MKDIERLPESESQEPAPKSTAQLPEQHDEHPMFDTIRQGTATNKLTRAKAKRQNTALDKITGIATVTMDGFKVTIPDFMNSAALKTSTYQLLDALTVKLTESGAKSPFVELPLEEYMAKRGLNDVKEARKQVKRDLSVLRHAAISFKEPRRKGREQDFLDVGILSDIGIRNGVIYVSFGQVLYSLLISYPIMPYPTLLWRLNAQYNPNSYFLLKELTEHKNMNVGKKNENLISVKTLLAASPEFPTAKEVLNTDRAFSRRIIDPFERDMDALSEVLSWEYSHIKGDPLSEEELAHFDFNLFKGLLIKVTWRDYPDQTARLERKAARMKQKENGGGRGHRKTKDQ